MNAFKFGVFFFFAILTTGISVFQCNSEIGMLRQRLTTKLPKFKTVRIISHQHRFQEEKTFMDALIIASNDAPQPQTVIQLEKNLSFVKRWVLLFGLNILFFASAMRAFVPFRPSQQSDLGFFLTEIQVVAALFVAPIIIIELFLHDLISMIC
jgi:hypothetical protein